ncbi:endonuclease/exonuclease/phosphatase family protein [Carboxylicivirga caseinilyticus]|uniref:endonuclease/exonuclease/phosphatase family protein n=1 Tax=Carboxylicivirga caseinilyticus TaxID=3417572 RepID=UPI003D326294|nr:endonuclease/exonuclease/phosphatase family protein [Marinilabiliaceae bacterium A049]
MKTLKIFTSIVIVLLFIQCQCSKESSLTVATFNIRYKNQSDSINGNGWFQRAPVICDMIHYNDFDVFGAQEVLHTQLNDMLDRLPEYSFVGVGRDDGKTAGEYAPIFYKRSKLTLINSGHFWLSEVTDKPNRGWDAALPRICTWAQFIITDSNQDFWCFNLHMDHIGVEARKESAKLVLKKIEEMCGKESVILTGDFNVDQSSANYAILANSSILNDAYEISKTRLALNGTFNNFNPNLKTDSRIDHIFVSSDISVNQYGILTDTYRSEIPGYKMVTTPNSPQEIKMKEYIACTPSDHFPVRAVITIK